MKRKVKKCKRRTVSADAKKKVDLKYKALS